MTIVHTQDSVPKRPISGEYIREWLVLGPFFPDDLEKDFLAHVGGEKNVSPEEGDTVTTEDGRTLTWKRYGTEEDSVNLIKAVGAHERATAYAFCILQSDNTGNGAMYLGSDDGAAVFLNGERVHYNPVFRSLVLDEDLFKVQLDTGENPCLVKISQGAAGWGFAIKTMPPTCAVVKGTVTAENEEPMPAVLVALYQKGRVMAQTKTDSKGDYQLFVYPVNGRYDVSAIFGEKGTWRTDVSLRSAERLQLDLTLRDAVSITGTVRMLDGTTPHVALPVEAVEIGDQLLTIDVAREERFNTNVAATVLSNEEGRYQFVNLLPGVYLIRCQTSSGFIYYGESVDKEKHQPISVHVPGDKSTIGMDFRFASFKKGTWKNYTIFDGLTEQRVNRISQAPDGRMWFGTQNGGSCLFDGIEFEPFIIKDRVRARETTSDGVLWFGTADGVSRYDGEELTNFTTKDGLVNNWVNDILIDDQGGVWFGTEGGVSRYDGEKFTNFTTKDGLVSNTIRDIRLDDQGGIWFGAEGGVSRYDGERFTSFTAKDGLVNNDVRVILLDDQGGMWFGTIGGVSRLHGGVFTNFTVENGLIGNLITDICQSSDGTVWFGTTTGLSAYNGKGIVNFTTHDGLVNDIILSLYCGEDDVLWIGTADGISRFHRQGMVNFTAKDGLFAGDGSLKTGSVLAVIFDIHLISDKEMWVGTQYGGVLKFDGEKFQRMTPDLGGRQTSWKNVWDICQTADGVLWFGASNGLIRYDGQRLEQVVSHEWVLTLQDDATGAIWFGNRHWSDGITKYEPDTGAITTFTVSDGLPNDRIWAIEKDADDVMWIGTDRGLCRYDGKGFTHETKGWDTPPEIQAIHIDTQGVLWFGGPDGVYRYDGEGFIHFTDHGIYSRHEDQFVLRTSDLRLPGSSIRAIYRTEDGITWFGTESHGIVGYDGVAFTTIDNRDGMAGNSVYSIAEDSSGFLWIGAIDGGLTRYRRDATPPGIHIRKVEFDDKEYTDFGAIPDITAGHRISVFYQELDFKTHPQKRQYQLIIRREDRETVKNSLTSERRYDWTPQEAGIYTFQVKAIDRDLNYSQPARVTLTIVPPSEELRQTREELATAYGDLQARNMELQEERNKLNSIIEAMNVGLTIRDLDYNITYMNPFMEDLYGDRRGEKCYAVFGYQDDICNSCTVEVALRDGGSHTAVREIVSPSGDVAFWENIANPIRDANGEITTCLEISRDITEHKRMEQEMQKIEKLEAIGILAGGIAHDLNNLLTGVVGNISLARMHENPAEKDARLVKAENASMRIKDLTQQLLTFSKGGAPIRQTASIGDLLKDSANFTLSGSNVRCDFSIPDDLWVLEIDEGQINQVINNLVTNAKQAMPGGGVIKIRAENTDINEDSGLPLEAGAYIRVSVEDEGIGISAEHIHRIFDPFYTTKHEGSGLGLATSYSIIEKHNGHITVESQIDVGTIFHIYLPAAPAETLVAEETAEKQPVMGTGRVLVMDDEEMIGELAANMLNGIGYSVTTAMDGAAALETYRKAMVSGNPFDAVILDLTIPGGMGGRETIEKLIEIDSEVKAIVSSGYSNDTVMNDFGKYGFKGVIAKPYKARELSEVLHSVITGKL